MGIIGRNLDYSNTVVSSFHDPITELPEDDSECNSCRTALLLKNGLMYGMYKGHHKEVAENVLDLYINYQENRTLDNFIVLVDAVKSIDFIIY